MIKEGDGTLMAAGVWDPDGEISKAKESSWRACHDTKQASRQSPDPQPPLPIDLDCKSLPQDASSPQKSPVVQGRERFPIRGAEALQEAEIPDGTGGRGTRAGWQGPLHPVAPAWSSWGQRVQGLNSVLSTVLSLSHL